ncbi:hypothetical protein [Larkinella soli]|uniref:hypothetical protein n=1 Tax=Larkinella soli TaxID=1770527 RepID=UPI000FFCC5EC|nr:hypothetical protein [Larkinella soli]
MNTTLLRNIGVTSLSVGGAVVASILSYYADVVHQPLLFMVLLNVAVGYWADRWPWAYVPLFCLVMAAAYFFVESQRHKVPEILSFCTVISPFPALFGLATGRLLNRIIKSR